MICFARMSRNQSFLLIGVLILGIVGLVGLFFPRPAASPTLPLEEVSATSTPAAVEEITQAPTQPAAAVQHPLPLAAGDTITSWDFKGAYTGNPELVTKAESEIARVKGLLATATSSKMILLVAIANEYELLGKGKEQYDYLGRAVRADSGNGLPWHNLGVLMERLHAYETARIAYKKAATLQPQFDLYHFAYIEFLIQNMKTRTDVIEDAFTAAEKSIGKVQYLADLRAMLAQP